MQSFDSNTSRLDAKKISRKNLNCVCKLISLKLFLSHNALRTNHRDQFTFLQNKIVDKDNLNRLLGEI